MVVCAWVRKTEKFKVMDGYYYIQDVNTGKFVHFSVNDIGNVTSSLAEERPKVAVRATPG